MIFASALPEPRGHARLGHLPRWGAQPLELLLEGHALARAQGRHAFALRLGVRAVVGVTPEWNRFVLTDLELFRSRGSFSALVPYLAGGIILTDAPAHRARRAALNPPFSAAQVAKLGERLTLACPQLPDSRFDALEWADHAVQGLLNEAYFSGEMRGDVLHDFLAPLRRPFPAPLAPRPRLFRRFRAELGRMQSQRNSPRGDLFDVLRALPGGLRETEVTLAAAHDTTTHALAYCLWLLAKNPQWQEGQHHRKVLKEVLRLYPPGWMGSRRVSRDTRWHDLHLPRGTLALYSPFLAGRDPTLWENPQAFDPARWDRPPPAWASLPFGGGARHCLGVHLAQLIILTVLRGLPPLQAHWGNEPPLPGLTLGPRGPLVVSRAKRAPLTCHTGENAGL